MSFVVPPVPTFPIPPIQLAGETDRFGLPLLLPGLLERDEDKMERISAVDRLIKDAFETAVRHLGYEETRRRFEDAVKRAPEGKQPDYDRNRKLLEVYDLKLTAGRKPRFIAGDLATERYPKEKGEGRAAQAERSSYAAQIRRLVKRRALEHAQRELERHLCEEWVKMQPPSLLEMATGANKADL
jgi:hypothetical protein